MRLRATLISVALLFAAAACSDSGDETITGQDTPPAGQTDNAGGPGTADSVTPGTDAGGGDSGGPPAGGWVRPQDSTAVRFCMDDSANQTYESGQVLWTGSWIWNAADNTITYTSSWLPEEGPYPPLYDDGPFSAGGHEPEGAVAGDHVFCGEVWVMPDPVEPLLFEYGVLDELKNWIWIGPNGQFTVEPGDPATMMVDPLILPPFGTFDLKVTLDLAYLHEEFAGTTADEYDIFIKGTMNSWFPAQLLDDGEFGDAAAGDGVFTYVHSNYLGSHNGRLLAGQEAQFVFVFALRELGEGPESGLEYKVAGDAVPDGVTAYSDFPAAGGGVWVEELIIQAQDSRGNTMNTAVLIGDETAGTLCDPGGIDCPGEEACADFYCGGAKPCDPASNPCPEGLKCEGGKCVPEVVEPECSDPDKPCPEGEKCEAGKCVPEVVEPECSDPDKPCPEGKKCVDGKCVDDVVQPPEEIDEAIVLQPHTASVFVGAPLPDLRARVTEAGVTDPVGRATRIEAQFGLALPAVADDDEAGWGFQAATYDGEDSGGEIYVAVGGAPAEPGLYRVAFRFRVDGGPWAYAGRLGTTESLDSSSLGELEVKAMPTDPVVDSLFPIVGAMKGGTEVTLKGAALDAATLELTFDGTPGVVQPSVSSAFEVVVVAPAHAAGVAALAASQGGHALTLPVTDFRYVPLNTPTPDGQVMTGAGAEWPDSYLLSSNDVTSDWSDANRLDALYAGYDDQFLYVAVKGTVQADHADNDNAIVVYVDVDPGAGTGFPAMGALEDATPARSIDDAISDLIESGPSGFGADFAFATVDMASHGLGIDLGGSTHAGWRKLTGLSGPGDLAWIDGEVLTNGDAGGIEARIPLTTLFDGPPPAGAKIAFIARLGTADGAHRSNQGLPPVPDGGSPQQPGDSVLFDLGITQ